MKTTGLMLTAFLFSSALFAQSADVKTEQTTKANVKAQSGKEGTTVSGSAKVKSDTKGNTTATDAAAESTQSAVALKKDASVKTKTAIETGDNLATEAGHAVSEEINAGIETGNTIAAQTGRTVKNTLSNSAGISGSLMNATRIKTGPIMINTQIISRSGLIIR